MNNPFMFIIGVTILGWLFPEIFTARNRDIPVLMNILSTIAFLFIAVSLVL